MDLQEEFNKLDLQKAALIGIALAIGYYFTLFDSGKNLEAQIVQIQQEMNANRTKLANIQSAVEDQKKYEAELKEISANMKAFKTYFSQDIDVNDLQAKVSTFAEETGVVVKSLKAGSKTPEFPQYIETVVDFEIEGSFHNIMEFISVLTSMKMAIDFHEMEFGTAVEGDFPKISLKSSLVVYSSKEEGGSGA